MQNHTLKSFISYLRTLKANELTAKEKTQLIDQATQLKF